LGERSPHDNCPGQLSFPAAAHVRRARARGARVGCAADVNRWLFWCGQHFSPAIGIRNWENVIKGLLGLGAADTAEVRRGIATPPATTVPAKLPVGHLIHLQRWFEQMQAPEVWQKTALP
jgi:hypothetical protein